MTPTENRKQKQKMSKLYKIVCTRKNLLSMAPSYIINLNHVTHIRIDDISLNLYMTNNVIKLTYDTAEEARNEFKALEMSMSAKDSSESKPLQYK